MDTLLFDDISDDEKMQITADINKNEAIVMNLKSPEARSKLFRSLMFVAFLIIIAVL